MKKSNYKNSILINYSRVENCRITLRQAQCDSHRLSEFVVCHPELVEGSILFHQIIKSVL